MDVMRVVGIVAMFGIASAAVAQPPLDELPVERQFDFWVGEWDVTNRFWNAQAGEAIVPGAALRVYPVLDGGALVEHYRGTSWNGGDILGFSVRAYDPAKDKWVIILNWPSGDANFWTMEGGFDFNRGLFYGETQQPNGVTRINRYIFSDLLPGFYRWEGSASVDDGQTWARPSYVMEGTRRGTDVEPFDDAWLHAEDIDERCPGDERRALDFTVGEWSGVAQQLQDDGSWLEMPTRLDTRLILGGCAVMSRFYLTTPAGETFEEFDVYAYSAQSEEWVGWALNDRAESPKRYAGGAEDDVVSLVTTLPDGVVERVRRFDATPDSFSWDAAWSYDDGETWTVLIKGEFSRTE